MCENVCMDWRGKIDSLRRAKKWTQEELAERVGVSVSTINSWIKGTRTPEMGNLRKIASVFGMSLDEFLRERLEENEKIDSLYSPPKTKSVPLLSWTQAARRSEFEDSGDSLAAEYSLAGNDEERVLVTASVGRGAFALRVKGDSMEPEFSDGCTIVVDPEKMAVNGSYVVVHVDDDEEATFKELIVDGSRKYLKPVNNRYPLLEMKGKKLAICGVVVQQIKNYY